jgi:hypothetical protein
MCKIRDRFKNIFLAQYQHQNYRGCKISGISSKKEIMFLISNGNNLEGVKFPRSRQGTLTKREGSVPISITVVMKNVKNLVDNSLD